MSDKNFEVAIFSDLTTSDALEALESDGKKYEGLYVDMEDKDQRKFVKDQASTIKELIKKVDRKRIDESKRYKAIVEAEAAEIKSRLEKANKPFTLLIDEWNDKRAKILAEEKRIREEKELTEQIERDHEEALQLNRLWDLEAKEREAQREAEKQAQIAREAEIAEQARKQALIDAENEQKAKAEREEVERLRREADTQHRASVNNAILSALTENGISEDDARKVVVLAAKGQLPNLTINY